jgi:hypothetical protein
MAAGATASRIPRLAADVAAKRSAEGWELFTVAAREALEQWDLVKTAVIEEVRVSPRFWRRRRHPGRGSPPHPLLRGPFGRRPAASRSLTPGPSLPPAAQWGGPSSRAKFDSLLSDLLMNCREQWDDGRDVHVDTLDVFLLEALTDDFGVDFEDDRIVTEASVVLQDLYRKCAGGQLAEAREVLDGLRRNPGLTGGGGAGGGGDDDGGDDDDGGERRPRRERIVDEDGWETVVVHRKGAKGGAAGGAPAAAGAAGGAGAAAAGLSRMSLAAGGHPAEGGGGDDDDDDDEDDDDEDEDEDGDGDGGDGK